MSGPYHCHTTELQEQSKNLWPENREKDEIEKLERELADLQRMARPEIPSAELDRVRGEVAQLRRDFYEHMGAWQRNASGAPSPASLHDGLRPHPV